MAEFVNPRILRTEVFLRKTPQSRTAVFPAFIHITSCNTFAFRRFENVVSIWHFQVLGPRMDRSYDIFEMLPDGSPIWRGTADGHENAIQKMLELSAKTANEVRVMHVPTSTVIATTNDNPRGTEA